MDFQSWQLARTYETAAIAKRNKKGSKSLVGKLLRANKDINTSKNYTQIRSNHNIYCMAQIL
jgi:hypothetical protein